MYTGMLSGCADKSGWVGVARARLWRACLVSGRGKASSRRARKAIASLRGEMMTQCDEPMAHLMTRLLTYALTLLFTGKAFSLSPMAGLAGRHSSKETPT